MSNRIINEGPKWVFLILWYVANIVIFVVYFFRFHDNINYYYLSQMTGLGLPFARGSAACLNFNCMLIMLPVCRNLISFLRGSLKCCKRNIRRQLDKNITFHIAVAYMICFHTAVHYFAHTVNFEGLWQAHDGPNNATRGLLSALSNLPSSPNGTWVNPIRIKDTHPTLEVFKNVAGITGVIITLALVLMVSAATETMRRSYFEIFWYVHHLFIIFFIGLVTHALGGVVRRQINVAEHDPIKCAPLYKDWGRNPHCPVPQFAPGTPSSWMWVIGPLVLYFIERCIRFYRSLQRVVITKVVKHPSRVIELQMKKKGFVMQPGQYIFLHCPSISRLEWHPFTLTSAPRDDHFSVHIRTVGDWTKALAEACHYDQPDFQESWKLPAVSIDGPFGTATEDIFQYQVDIMVGAGIGVTPFASVLKDIWYQHCDPNVEMKLQKVYFFWICPDTNAFEWFTDVVKVVENQMAEAGMSNFLDVNLYLTRGWDANVAKNIILHAEDEHDILTGLQHKTQYGRPNWDQIFSTIAQAHPGTSVGVFFCGPKVLSTTLHKMSNKHSSSDPNGVNFFYNKENF